MRERVAPQILTFILSKRHSDALYWLSLKKGRKQKTNLFFYPANLSERRGEETKTKGHNENCLLAAAHTTECGLL